MKCRLTCLILLIYLFQISCNIDKSIVVLDCKNAPKAIGPYSHALSYGNMVFCSGQIGLLPETGTLAGDDITTQTHQALKNIKAILEDAGSDLNHVVKVTIFLKDLNEYSKVNDIYKDYFTSIKPARSVVQAARLPKDALLEIECIAVKK